MSSTNPYAPPQAAVDDPLPSELRYVGFWSRTLAALIDALLIMAITYPILWAVYGSSYFEAERVVQGPVDVLLTWVFPAVAAIAFWARKQATPGKMAVSAKIVDADTGGPLSIGQSVGRYFAYILAALPLGLGILWVAFDKRKQGWHDKLAGTLVVRSR